jgi:hypothetical protein
MAVHIARTLNAAASASSFRNLRYTRHAHVIGGVVQVAWRSDNVVGSLVVRLRLLHSFSPVRGMSSRKPIEDQMSEAPSPFIRA